LASRFSLADFLQGNKLFAMIAPMRSKEQVSPEGVFFRSRARDTWLIVPSDKARDEFGKLDLNDWQTIRHLWVVSPRGRTTKIVARRTGLTEEEVRRMPPGSWISFDGREKFVPNSQG
jgi:hypothetical protein